MTLLVILVLGGFAWYVMEPAERTRLLRAAAGVAGQARGVATRMGTEQTTFEAALHARTRLVIVTPVLATLNVVVFLLMLAGSGALAEPATLIEWGGNFGPNTSNGQWGRLATSLFLHTGPLHLLVNVLALVQVGFILERLLGHFAFAAVYLTAGVFAGLVNLYAQPLHASVGASGAVSGLYGLLLAAWLWGALRRSAVTIPLESIRTLGPMAALFVLYNALEASVPGAAEWIAFAAGFAGGLVLAKDVSERKPALGPVAVAMAAALAITVASAAPLRGIANVRPELEHLVALETRLAESYDEVVRQFRRGTMSAEQLAQVIDSRIRPELQAAKARLEALSGVAAEQQALVSAAEEYLRLRDESWRIRSEALHQADMKGLREADRSEHASLQVFRRLAAALADRSAG